LYKDILSEDEFSNFITSYKAALVYFSKPTCNVCRVLKPKIYEMLENNFPQIEAAYINCESSKELAAQNKIFTVPVIIIYFEGKEFIRKTRNSNIAELKNELNRPYSLLFD